MQPGGFRRPWRGPWRLLIPLGLALMLSGPFHAVAPAGAVGVWEEAAPPAAARAEHSATLLADGTVLVAGGDAVGTAERYDPQADRWLPAGALVGPRLGHTATALPGGRVLVVGGVGDAAPVTEATPVLATAERYDPATSRWAVVAPMATARVGHTATLLRDGRVLVVGGAARIGGAALSTAALYDPAADRWTAAAGSAEARSGHTATLLADGRVLVAGGGVGGNSPLLLSSAELYDPVGDRWSPLPPMAHPRVAHAAALLPNGKVLVVGGAGGNAGGASDGSAELFDPARGIWLPVAAPRTARLRPTTTALPDGQVLVLGGGRNSEDARQVERYDPAADRWVGDAPLATGRVGHSATLLPGGDVVVVGGFAFPPPGGAQRSAERHRPAVAPAQCFAETGQCLRGPFAAYWQAHGGLALNGYPLAGEQVAVLEDGRAYAVQYCERVRLEYHPENAAPYDILLGQFGRHFHPADPPAAAIPGVAYFAETGHNVTRPEFVAYWRANGGLAQFGYPLSEEFTETLEDGQPYSVQYFERARFEWHPENGDPYKVLLGQFGRRLLAEQQP